MSSPPANMENSFDAFRTHGGPTLYSSPNRTAVLEDLRNVLIYIAFSTLFLAFIIVFPGIRKERISTLLCVTVSLFVGAVILASNYGTDWHVAQATISSPYRAFSREKVSADVGVRIGLNSVNITLKATSKHRNYEEINYNERFCWVGAVEMKEDYRRALVKGLPFPILTIAEYLSQEGEGLSWGRRYRTAGYYVHIILWAAFALWLLMNLLVCTVLRYAAYAMQMTGAVMLGACALYYRLLPRSPLVIPFEDGVLTFTLGWCFWIVVGAGSLSLVVGMGLLVADLLYPHSVATILEVDYDSPYRITKPGGNGGLENPAFKKEKSVGEFLPSEPKKGFSFFTISRRFEPAVVSPPSTSQVNLDVPAAALW